MREERGKLILGVSLGGLLVLTSVAFAQPTPVPPASAARSQASAVSEQAAPAVADGRIVNVVSQAAGLSPDAIAKVRAAFNRRLPRDLRSYPLGDVLAAAEAAVAEATVSTSSAKPRVCITISCCPLTISIKWPCTGSME